ncbi:hypothetical protein HYALB_00006210 [Hymenoscyphus albidus]|uniref:Cytochrome P450 n=1 Tax=Hymenoscyphus albidus TaxID=595503 RepID=A0A9N9LZT9_9HELO|nr:hypothetical protein HYALB_00006210 [Hymenoscyphus albidus]
MALLLILLSVLLAIIIKQGLNIHTNYKLARTIGLPILITPVEPLDPFWRLTLPFLAPILRRLPYGLGEWIDHGSFASSFASRNKIHRDLGPAIVVVTPRRVKIMLGDGNAVEDILSRYREFIKPPSIYTALNVFGENVDSVNKDKWQRHRKITAPSFNERNSNIVWTEALHQATTLLNLWTYVPGSEISTTHKDSLTLALNVLLGAGFGRSSDFNSVSSPSPGHSLSFQQSLHTVLQKFVFVILSSSLPETLRNLLPDKNNQLSTAIQEFKQYLIEMVAEERLSLQKGGKEKHTLVSALLRAADLEDQESRGNNYLSNDEIYGNLFIYCFAGHDTTANTISYALTLLASHEEAMAWVKEEITAVLGPGGDGEMGDYEKVFPQLKRCLAVMVYPTPKPIPTPSPMHILFLIRDTTTNSTPKYETLRLFGPVQTLPRDTEDTPTTLQIQGTTHTIPPNTLFMINFSCAHTDTNYWGQTPNSPSSFEDAWTFRPSRWLIPTTSPSTPFNEDLLVPPRGTYFPWASGPRICPGRKFSQVEFVAVIARLFRKHHLKVAALPGKSDKMVRERTRRVLADSSVKLTLSMNDSTRVRFIWVED